MKKELLSEIVNSVINKQITIIKELSEIKDIDKEQITEYYKKIYPESLNEMARINVNEFYDIFPYNKFEIKIWSNGHNPPHFHVIAEDWDIIVDIESGDILKTKKVGKNSKVYSFVEKNVKEWLDSKSAIDPNRTNRENAMFTWNQENN